MSEELKISPSNPYTILHGIRRFGLAADGSDIREIGGWLDRWQTENSSLRAELAVTRDILLNPNPDDEPDNIRLHREKCDALDRAYKAEAALASARKALEYISRYPWDYPKSNDAVIVGDLARAALSPSEQGEG